MTQATARASAGVLLVLAATAARAATTQPAAQPAVGAAEMKILRQLEAAGEKHRAIRAEIDYRVDLRKIGDSEQRSGWVAYTKGDDKVPAKFRVTFLTLKQGSSRPIKAQVDYAFDGEWLTVAKHKIKNVTMYQLAAKGQRIEPLRIGKGPFPLPFGQKADDMARHFTVSTRRPRASDPKGTVYVRLIPRPPRAKVLPTTRLELWVDAATHLPVKIRSRDKNGNVTMVTFSKLQTNKAVDAGVFHIPRRLGWETIRRPLKGAAGVAP